MGLIDGKCDSCKEDKTILFPLAVLDELPSGGERIVVRYYCKSCYETMADAAEDFDNEDEEEEEDKDTHSCACCNNEIILRKDEVIGEYFCFGYTRYICESCSIAYEGIGPHSLENHREACREKGNHP
jgi:hypothetical protein